MSRNFWTKIILIIIILGSGSVVFAKLQDRGYFVKPCSQPIEYSIGDFDPQFNISQFELSTAVEEASHFWEKAINKNLFVAAGEGDLKINLIYDERQATTDTLGELDSKIEKSQASYNNLKAQHVAKVAEYEQAKASFEAEVSYWNSKGGAPKDEYNQLKAKQTQLNQMVGEINSLVNNLNALARQLNLNVANYNTIGRSLGEEFEEGVYISDREGERIDIYEFSDRAQLVRLLAHELGHALGLEHVEDPTAVMYRLNTAENSTITNADLTELKKACKIE